jgi:hypothetical protein
MGSAEKDYWKRQRELPLHRRSRGWWIEEGSAYIFVALFIVMVIAATIYGAVG